MRMQRGFRDKLEKYADTNNDLTVNMSVNGSAEYDFCCFGVDTAGKLSDDRYMIFYNQTHSPQNEIVYSSAGKTCSYTLRLSALPSSIVRLVFTVSIDGAQTMHDISSHTIEIKQGQNTIADMQLSGNDFQAEKAVISLEIYKKDVWRFAAVASGFNGGLGDLLREFGGEEASSDSVPVQQSAPSYGSPMPMQQETPSYGSPMPTQQSAPSYGSPMPMQQEAPSYGSPMLTQQSAPSYGSPMPTQQSAPSYGSPIPMQQEAPSYGSPMPMQQEAPSYDSPMPTQQSAPSYGSPMPTQQSAPSCGSPMPMQQEAPSYGSPMPMQQSAPSYGSYNSPAPSPTSRQGQPKVSLEKKLQAGAPKLVSLAKPLQLELEKRDLQNCVARVALVLDISASMTDRYQDGTVQEIVNKTLPLAVQFDDDGQLDFWIFAKKPKRMDPVTMSNYDSSVPVNWHDVMKELKYSNNEPAVMELVIKEYKNTTLPAYVLFITDGDVMLEGPITKLITKSSKLPIFWQFVGVGGYKYGVLEHLDSMEGRYVDNANFFALDDFKSVSNQELYSRLLNEFPSWLNAIRQNGMI